jgi:hypothetical protein
MAKKNPSVDEPPGSSVSEPSPACTLASRSSAPDSQPSLSHRARECNPKAKSAATPEPAPAPPRSPRHSPPAPASKSSREPGCEFRLLAAPRAKWRTAAHDDAPGRQPQDDAESPDCAPASPFRCKEHQPAPNRRPFHRATPSHPPESPESVPQGSDSAPPLRQFASAAFKPRRIHLARRDLRSRLRSARISVLPPGAAQQSKCISPCPASSATSCEPSS